MMRISIILPTYNGSQYIAKAINSVLAQSFSDWELIIIDDGSFDNTNEVILPFKTADGRISFMSNECNLGIQKTLNRGIRLATGEYVARIDDDDEWIDIDKLRKQVVFMDSHPEYVLVGTGVILVNVRGEEINRYLLPGTDDHIRQIILSKNCFVHSSVLFRKSVATSLHGYDESIESKHVEDYDLWLRLGIAGKMANLPFYGVRFTLRDGNISSKNKSQQFNAGINIIKKYYGEYPNYFVSIFRAYIRLWLYGKLGFIPLLAIKFKFLNLCRRINFKLF